LKRELERQIERVEKGKEGEEKEKERERESRREGRRRKGQMATQTIFLLVCCPVKFCCLSEKTQKQKISFAK
jgi:hypothetical protein